MPAKPSKAATSEENNANGAVPASSKAATSEENNTNGVNNTNGAVPEPSKSASSEQNNANGEGKENGKGAVIGPAPDLDESNFEKLNSLLDKTMAYSQFIRNNLPDQASGPGTAKVGEKRKASDKASEKDDLVVPSLLTNGALRDYQLVGVNWLISLFKNGINGILADEMGLGKTIITIGFLAHLWEKKLFGPFLIVAPLSTLANWQKELAKWCPFMPSVLYHGTKDERQTMREDFARKVRRTKNDKNGAKEHAGVLITSYDIAINDVKFLSSVKWKYLMVDEAHRLKNFECKLIRELKRLDTTNRLLITGTPLQNNLSELWSLLNFILPEIFDDLDSFKSWFDFDDVDDDTTAKHIIHSEQQNQVISKLHDIMRPFMLRRLKKDVGLDLPPKREIVLYCGATPKQLERYDAIRTKTFQDLVEAQKGARPARILNTVMQLRKICNHPFLFEAFDPFVVRTETEKVVKEIVEEFDLGDRTPYRQKRKVVETITREIKDLDFDNPAHRKQYNESLVAECGKFSLLHKMLPVLKKAGHKCLIFSQMTSLLDLLEDYLDASGLRYCRIDGGVAQKDRQARIEAFNTDPDLFLFLLSTRAGGLGINLVSADTVIIYDSDWNPQADLQAQDRVHRIGQTKPVVVYRMITANTVESHLLRRATQKLKLEHLVIEKGKFASRDKKSSGLQVTDLEEVLNMTSGDHTFGKDCAITDAKLSKLLNRRYVMNLLDKEEQERKRRKADPEAEEPRTPASPLDGGGFEVIEEIPTVF